MEPRFELAETIIFYELSEVTEVIFFVDGKFDLGFEINGKLVYVIRYVNSSTKSKSFGEGIGEYGCTLNKTSRFIYKTAAFCDGFYIRKKKWSDLMEENSYVAKAYT